MPGVPVIPLLGEGFVVYRETANAHVCVLISHDNQLSLYIVEPRLAAVPEDIVEVGLVAVPEEDVMAFVEPI